MAKEQHTICFIASASEEKYKPLVIRKSKCHKPSTRPYLPPFIGGLTRKLEWLPSFLMNTSRASINPCNVKTKRLLSLSITPLVISTWISLMSGWCFSHQKLLQEHNLWTPVWYRITRWSTSSLFLNICCIKWIKTPLILPKTWPR